MYINIWHDLRNNEDVLFEQAVSKTVKEAFAQYREEDCISVVYCHTLKIDGDTVEKLYLGECDEDEDEGPVFEYEKLTGHEMGVCSGRA